jgi:hypothetical protein
MHLPIVVMVRAARERGREQQEAQHRRKPVERAAQDGRQAGHGRDVRSV